jgi:hypothetical protein
LFVPIPSSRRRNSSGRIAERAGFYGEDRRKRTPGKIRLQKGGRGVPADLCRDTVLV